MSRVYADKSEYAISTFLLLSLPLKDALQAIAARGFEHVEIWCAGLHLDPRGETSAATAASWLRETGQRVHSVHAPFGHAAFPHPTEADAFHAYRMNLYRQTIDTCNAIECPIMVVHAVNRTEFNSTDADIGRMREDIASLVDYGRQSGVRLAIENIIGSGTPGEFVCTLQNQTRAFAGLGAGYCLDIGHAPLTDADLCAEADAAGADLVSFHIHNNNGIDDTHELPDNGVIDWPALYDYVRQKGYTGQFTMEIMGSRAPEESLERLDKIAALFDK